MGGLTSKTFKLGKKEKPDPEPEEEEKRSSVTGVQYRDKDKELLLSRETQSAFYYGSKNGIKDGVEKSEDGQKRVVLQNVPIVEKRIKVIRDGSSDITIRPMSITRQKHEMIIDHTVNKKPRDNILNTYSVMVKTKETNAVPTATVTLDEDKGLTAIEEGKERESQLLTEEEKGETSTTDKREQQSTTTDAQKDNTANAEEQKEQRSIESETKEPGMEQATDNDSEIKPTDNTENENMNEQNENDISNTEPVKTDRKLEEDFNNLQTVSPKIDNSSQAVTDDTGSNNTSAQQTGIQTSGQSDKHVVDAERENAITDKDTGITVVKDTQLDGNVS